MTNNSAAARTPQNGRSPIQPQALGGQAVLPFPETDQLDPMTRLAARARRLANVVEAISRRRDVRERRARLLLMLIDSRCPTRARPRKSWYTPGAVARWGAEGIARAWATYWGEEPPSLRTIRAHLGALEGSGCLVRSPGDWIPMPRNPDHPERRPRYAQTIHLLESDEAAGFWAGPGRELLERNPEARHNPDRWRMLFASWRYQATQADLYEDLEDVIAPDPAHTPAKVRGGPKAKREPQALELEAAATLAMAVRPRRADPVELMSSLARAGARVTGRNAWQLARSPSRLRGAAAMLVIALERGDAIRSRPGWLVRAFRFASSTELADATDLIARRENVH